MKITLIKMFNNEVRLIIQETRSHIVIVDDYGYWEGAHKAVDEFLEASPVKYFLHRIDQTSRLLIK